MEVLGVTELWNLEGSGGGVRVWSVDVEVQLRDQDEGRSRIREDMEGGKRIKGRQERDSS